MKMNTVNIALFAMSSLALLSCKKEVIKEETPAIESGYLTGLRTLSGATSADYVVTSANLMSGEIHANGIGIEQSAWTYYYQKDKKTLAMSYGDNPVCTAYEVESGVVKEKGSFSFLRLDAFADVPNSSNVVSIGAPWGGGSFDVQIQTINTSSMSISQTVASPLYEMYDDTNARLNMWPTSAYIDNNKLFVAFYPLHGSSWNTERVDTAYIGVYSYPGLTHLKTMKDIRTSPIGYYMVGSSIVSDESGNHYTFSSSSSAAGFTKITKPSGILKINAGQDEFDPSYFFNVEALGYKIMSGTYVGNNKIVARVLPVANDTELWGAFNAATAIHKIAVINLSSQTIEIVDEIPLHGGQYFTPYFTENGKVYMSINNGAETYVYEIDPATAIGKKGAKVLGDQLQHIFKY